MKILVTGGAGFIGSNLIKRLLDEGHIVHSFDDYSTGKLENEHKGCIYHVGDINGIGLLETYDKIYHLAALSRIQPSFLDPDKTYEVNTLGTQKVLEHARLTGAKVIYAGSSSKWHDPYQSPYAACKYMGEEACKMYKRTFNMDVEIARFYNVYGPNEIVDGDMAAVIGIWRRQVRDGEPLTIVGDGEQRRDFTHVTDIVDALYRIGFQDSKHEDAWELGTGINYSINEVFNMFRERFNCEAIYIKDQPGNYRKTLRENNDTLLALGWKPQDRLYEYVMNLTD